MPVEFSCPSCRTVLQTPDESVGLQTRCPTCGAILVIPAGGQALSAVRTPSIRETSEPAWDDSPPPDHRPFSWEQLHPLAPAHFSTTAALWFGWQLFRAYWAPFVVGNVVSLALLALVHLTTAAATGESAARWAAPAATGCCALFFAGGWAALAVHAAHGKLDGPRIVLAGFLSPWRILGRLGSWAILTALWHAPFLLVWWGLFAYTRSAFAQLVGGLCVLAAGILAGVRIGWVPFAFWEFPDAGFRDLLKHSLDISRGRTTALLQLAFLTYFALAGLAILLPLFGLPLAMGIGGATYVLLAREQPPEVPA